MHRPSAEPRASVPQKHPTWGSILTSYATLALVPLGLWVVNQPLAATVVLAVVVGLFIGVQRVNRLARCFHDCQGLTLDLGGLARITVSQVPAEDTR